MALTAFPPLPSRQDPATFAERSDAFLGHLPTFVTEVNALQADVTSKQGTSTIDAGTATTKAGEAAASATLAQNWATQLVTPVSGGEYSAKYHGLLAKDWASKLGSPVSGSDYSAKHYAQEAGASAAAAATSLNNINLTEKLNLGSKTSNPSVDNQGDPLLVGAMYFNSVAQETRVYTGTLWKAAGTSVNATAYRYSYTATAAQTTFSATYDVGYVDVYLNGLKLDAADFTADNGSSIVLAAPAAAGDVINIIGYGTFVAANQYSKPETDAILAAQSATVTAQLSAQSAQVSSLVSSINQKLFYFGSM
jgi:hypothetical protein